MLRTKAERISRRVYQCQQVEKIKRKAIEDCVEEDLKTAGVTKFGKTSGRQNDTVRHCGGQRTVEGVGSTGIYG